MTTTLVNLVSISSLRFEHMVIAKLQRVLQGVAVNLPTHYLELCSKGFSERCPSSEPMILVSMIDLSIFVRVSDKRTAENILRVKLVALNVPASLNLTQAPIPVSEIPPGCLQSRFSCAKAIDAEVQRLLSFSIGKEDRLRPSHNVMMLRGIFDSFD